MNLKGLKKQTISKSSNYNFITEVTEGMKLVGIVNNNIHFQSVDEFDRTHDAMLSFGRTHVLSNLEIFKYIIKEDKLDMFEAIANCFDVPDSKDFEYQEVNGNEFAIISKDEVVPDNHYRITSGDLLNLLRANGYGAYFNINDLRTDEGTFYLIRVDQTELRKSIENLVNKYKNKTYTVEPVYKKDGAIAHGKVHIKA